MKEIKSSVSDTSNTGVTGAELSARLLLQTYPGHKGTLGVDSLGRSTFLGLGVLFLIRSTFLS